MVKRAFILIGLLTVLCGCKDYVPPVKEGYVIANNSDVYYKTIGEGEPLLIIHGGPVLDHSYFLPHLEPLAQDYQLIFYDQRACGKSAVAIDSATMNLDGFVEDIEFIRKSLNLEKINVLGHSWGGLIAMKYAIAHDDKIDQLILSSPMAPSTADWMKENSEVAKLTVPEDQRKFNSISGSGVLRTEDPSPYIKEMLELSFKSQFYKEELTKLNLFVPQDYMLRSGVFGLLGPDLNAFDLWNDLASVQSKTMVVYGEIELGGLMHGKKLASTLANGQFETIAKSGHFPFIESPEAYFNKIRAFLKD